MVIFCLPVREREKGKSSRYILIPASLEQCMKRERERERERERVEDASRAVHLAYLPCDCTGVLPLWPHSSPDA